MKRIVKISLVPVLGGVLVGALVLQARGNTPSKAPSLPLAESARIHAEGRIVSYPGAEVEVGVDIPGTLVRLLASENMRVRKGELLAEIRTDVERAALTAARARLDEAVADVRFFDRELARDERLLRQETVAPGTVDRTRRDAQAARARRAAAAAETQRLEALLDKAHVTSPIDGTVIARHVDSGETVGAGARLFTLADLTKRRIEAEVDEFDAGRVRLGAPVRVSAEGYTGSWQGSVEEIPDVVVARSLKPQDPGRPSDTRVLLVKIALAEPVPVKLGQRVEVELGH